jgi:hypothetical protein
MMSNADPSGNGPAKTGAACIAAIVPRAVPKRFSVV